MGRKVKKDEKIHWHGERMAQRQETLGLTNRDLARMLDISEQRISEYRYTDKYDVEPKIGRLGKIARVLGVSMEWLCGDADDPEPVVLTDDERNLLKAYRANSLDLLNIVLLKQARESLGQEGDTSVF